jgi:sugar phosphate isomerase/epimerase
MDNPLAVSTWSLHRLLGTAWENGPGRPQPERPTPTWGRGTLTLRELPDALAEHGYNRVEICHFHLPVPRDPGLKRLGQRFRATGIAVQTLLIDDGDLTGKADLARDRAWIGAWLEAASELGASHARVIAGKAAPSPATLSQSAEELGQIARRGRALGVRVVTENWFDLLATPAAVATVLDAVGPDLGFLADTGNWSGPSKYADLRSIFARAELCHAKSGFGPGLAMDENDAAAFHGAARDAAYGGPWTLIYDGPDADEWAGLEAERRFLRAQG